jgi:hypothetical protein
MKALPAVGLKGIYARRSLAQPTVEKAQDPWLLRLYAILPHRNLIFGLAGENSETGMNENQIWGGRVPFRTEVLVRNDAAMRCGYLCSRRGRNITLARFQGSLA